MVDYFITNHRNITSVDDFHVITMSQMVEELGLQGVVGVPSKISDHSMIIMNIMTRDPDIMPEDAEAGSDHLRQGAHMRAPSGGDGPRPPPRFKIDTVPTDFLTSDETRQELLRLISDIEQSRDSQLEIDSVYDDIVKLYIGEMNAYFDLKTNIPTSRKKFRFTRKEWWDDELTDLFKIMQKAEHVYIKAKKNHQHFRELFKIFKQKQSLFDKTLKRKKRQYQRQKCLDLEKINSSDPNSFWDYNAKKV